MFFKPFRRLGGGVSPGLVSGGDVRPGNRESEMEAGLKAEGTVSESIEYGNNRFARSDN
jgi:hypothetical protein